MFRNVFKSGIRAIYNVSDTPSFHSDCWNIYPAKHKQTGRIVSVFIFDKPSFESLVNRVCAQSPNTKNPKLLISECYTLVKSGVTRLAKLKHPQILTVIEILEETKLKFLFVTEPVVGNLQTIKLGDTNSIEIQKGLLEISKALQFLHNVCGMVHMNVQPTAVMINSLGDWKLSAFYFLQCVEQFTAEELENFAIMNVSSVVPFANLNLNFMAPELILDSTGLRLSAANDIWSLGQLVFYLHNDGEGPIDCFDTASISEFKQTFKKFEQKFYNHRAKDLRYMFKNVPEVLWQTLIQMLARFPNDRLTIDQFIESDYFDGSLIKTMWFIDEFSTKTLEEKNMFLAGILENSGILSDLPSSFKHNKLLPLLVDSINTELLCVSSKALSGDANTFVSRALDLVLAIGKQLSKLSFQDRIFDVLFTDIKSKKATISPLELIVTSSVNVRLVVVNNLNVLKQKLHSKDLAIIWKSLSTLCLTYLPREGDLQADQITLQDSFLASLNDVIEVFDYLFIKNELLPLISQVFKTTTILSTKLCTIEAFRLLINRKMIDQMTIVEVIIPVFENLKSRDKRIVGATLAYFVDQMNSELVKLLDVLVERLLSQCHRLAFACDNCSQDEFQGFMGTLRTIESTLVQRRLEELPSKVHSTQEHQKPSNFDTLINASLIKQAPNIGEQTPKLTSMKPSRDLSKSMNEERKALEVVSLSQTESGPSSSSLLRNHKPNSLSSHYKDGHSKAHVLSGSQSTPSKSLAQDLMRSYKGNANFTTDTTNGPPPLQKTRKFPPGFSNTTLIPDVAVYGRHEDTTRHDNSLI